MMGNPQLEAELKPGSSGSGPARFSCAAAIRWSESRASQLVRLGLLTTENLKAWEESTSSKVMAKSKYKM